MKRKFVSELFGTAFLLMIVVGSGMMGESLANGNQAIALLANSLATGLGLWVLIQCLGCFSGAHFNPVVSLVEMLGGSLEKKEMVIYWSAQFLGAFLGVILSHFMFGQELFQVSTKNRNELHFGVSEIIATFGLISTITLARKKHGEFAPALISAYIASAYWFTSSTSFANPAVSIARGFTNTFCGISPSGLGMFVSAQFVGSILSYYLLRTLAKK